MQNKTLLIMAAGMGSRFGGLKQIEEIGPNGEFLIDYSIYDAIRAGFNKVIFIIKEENYEIFKETIGRRIEEKIKVDYAFQKNDNLPEGYNIEREKPLGTAHALLCAKNKINEPFGVISADDFYGKEAFIDLANFLDNSNKKEPEYATICYLVKNIVSKNGGVKRGICKAENGYIVKLMESVVTFENNIYHVQPLNGDTPFDINENHLVSMLMIGFNPTVFKMLEDKFVDFFKENINNMEDAEYLLPVVLNEFINEGKCRIKSNKTVAKWYGITYKEDKEKITKAIIEMIENGEYPGKLWD